MQKLVLGSGLSLVLLGGALTAQAQSDPKSEDRSKTVVKAQEELSRTTTKTTPQSPKIKFDGIDGELKPKSDTPLGFNDIKADPPPRAEPFLKIDTIPGESKANSTPFLKIDDIKGEATDSAKQDE